MQKADRQKAILELIVSEQIGTQEELADLLEKNGLTANQSSVSRDLDELGIIKIGGFYALPTKKKQGTFGLLNVEKAGDCLLIVKCSAGLASAVAVKIDAAEMAEIVGTIAGDDTIFVAIREAKSQKQTAKKIWELFDK